MRAVTIKDAKARLNELVDAAVSGEQVVLMRGSTLVAAIVPVTAEEIELPTRLTDEQAARFWRLLAAEEESTGSKTFASAEAAVAHLARKPSPKRPRRRG